MDLLSGARRLEGKDFFQTLADKPWIAVLIAAGLGIFLGLCVSCCRKCRRRGRVGTPPGQERPWECVRLVRRCCQAASQCKQAGLLGFWYHLLMTRTCIVTSLALVTLGLSAGTFATSIALRVRLDDMRANMVGDPERVSIDECMRDFEGLSAEDTKYQEHLRGCIAKLEEDDRYRWLPRIRLAVDERVCEPASLCSGAPSGCEDEGDPLSSDYRPGSISKCYQLIGQSKAARDHRTRADLQAQAELRCTGSTAWEDYDKKPVIKYCMWKHSSVGLCMNTMRTNCPEDDSCCPVAENARAGGANRVVRQNQYTCQKSPTVGLYCQHVDYRVPGPGNLSDRPVCTDVTCDTFAWCRDMADVPGDCIGESCQAYQRSLDLAVVIVLCMAFAILCDVSYVVMLVRFPKPRLKGFVNIAGGCCKLLAYAFLVAGGIDDFVGTAVSYSCFTVNGNTRVAHAKDFVDALDKLTLVTMAGSVCLSPLSMHWGSQLVGLPYFRNRAVRET